MSAAGKTRSGLPVFAAPEFLPGHVWLAGAGPGSLEWLTLGVLRAIRQADAIVHDALVDPAILAEAPNAEIHYAGKRGGKVSASQREINDLLVRLAKENKRVLRLKGGDPFIFGRGGEEILNLHEAGVPFRVLPGVTSAFGAAASAMIPMTMRGINRAVILATGHPAGSDGDLDWGALARTGQPVVIYMGLTNLAHICESLATGGMPGDTPVAIVRQATYADETVLETTLDTAVADVQSAGIASPAVIFVGGIVSMRRALQGGGDRV